MTSRAKPAKKAPSGISLIDEQLFISSTATETQQNQGPKKNSHFGQSGTKVAFSINEY